MPFVTACQQKHLHRYLRSVSMITFGESGPAVELIKKYGLDADGIYAKVKEFRA